MSAEGVARAPMKSWGECTEVERIERWVNVERVLNDLPPHEREKHFDMRRWGYENDCGTVGCAAGLCSLDDWFRSQGWIGKFLPISMCDQGWWEPEVYGNVRAVLTLDNGTPDGVNMGMYIRSFFGPTESEFSVDRIFFNDEPRSVDTVLTEVRQRITVMRRELGVPA